MISTIVRCLGTLSLLSVVLFPLARAEEGDDGTEPPANCTGCGRQPGFGDDLTAKGTINGGASFNCSFTINLVVGTFAETCTTSTSNCGSSTCKLEWSLVMTQTGGDCSATNVTPQEHIGTTWQNMLPPPGFASFALGGGNPQTLHTGTINATCGGNKTQEIKLTATKSGINATWDAGDDTLQLQLKCADCKMPSS